MPRYVQRVPFTFSKTPFGRQAYFFDKKAQVLVWAAEEMNLAQDRVQWDSVLTEEEQTLFRHVCRRFSLRRTPSLG